MNPLRVKRRIFLPLAVTVAAIAVAPSYAVSEILAGPIANPFHGHDYHLLSEDSWTAAEQEAVGLGGHLVTINDQQEQDWVWSLNDRFRAERRSGRPNAVGRGCGHYGQCQEQQKKASERGDSLLILRTKGIVDFATWSLKKDKHSKSGLKESHEPKPSSVY